MNTKESKRILIMGARGFLGSQLVRKMSGLNNFELYTPSHVELDAMKYQDVYEYIKYNNIQYVIHAVANHAGIGTGINKELFFLETNLLMNYNIVKASYENSVKKFITFGTSCCYNNPNQIFFNESEYWKNKSEISYGSCKRIMLEQLQLQDLMNWVYLVPPNLYGPGDHFGEDHTHFVPATYQKFDKAIKNKEPFITVWGDGTQMRDFLYIDDLVDIVILALSSNVLDKEIINVATMVDHSIKEVVAIIQKTMGCIDIDIKWDISKPTGVSRKILDNSKFVKMVPDFVFTDIVTGIEQTSRWHQNGNSFDGI